MIRDGYVARWRGEEFDASPDGDRIRLYSASPRTGFEEIGHGRYRRTVAAEEVSDFGYVRTTCVWRGEPFIVLGEYGSWLRVEYTGGQSPVAAALGLEEFDFGVYQGWARAAEVADVRQQRV